MNARNALSFAMRNALTVFEEHALQRSQKQHLTNYPITLAAG